MFTALFNNAFDANRSGAMSLVTTTVNLLITMLLKD